MANGSSLGTQEYCFVLNFPFILLQRKQFGFVCASKTTLSHCDAKVNITHVYNSITCTRSNQTERGLFIKDNQYYVMSKVRGRVSLTVDWQMDELLSGCHFYYHDIRTKMF